jgi:NADPH:quinone reductase-like Zn-dependent oxidoreductase
MPHAIQIRQTGGPEILNWTAVDVGEPGSGQVRLRQAAAGLNCHSLSVGGRPRRNGHRHRFDGS